MGPEVPDVTCATRVDTQRFESDAHHPRLVAQVVEPHGDGAVGQRFRPDLRRRVSVLLLPDQPGLHVVPVFMTHTAPVSEFSLAICHGPGNDIVWVDIQGGALDPLAPEFVQPQLYPGEGMSLHVIIDQLPPFGPVLPGDAVHFQAWYRDAAAGVSGTSDAVKLWFD